MRLGGNGWGLMRSTAATALAAQRTRPWNAAVAAGTRRLPATCGRGSSPGVRRNARQNAVTWTTLISGLTDAGYPAEARRVFNAMPVKSVPAWTAIVDGHMKDGEPGEARQCFDGMPLRNMVSWMAFIRGYVRSGMFAQAFDRFVEMARTPGAAQNEFTFSLALGACAGSSSLRSGEFLHADLIKCGGPPDAILVSSLVGMYAKCCDASVAARAFGSLGRTSLVCWKAVIGCYARQGLRARALAEFQRNGGRRGAGPRQLRLRPRRRARGGLVREGERWFQAMEGEFGLRHGSSTTCVVDLLGRAGELLGGQRVVDEMPVAPDLVVLGALAAASRMHGGLELLGLAADRIGEDHPAVFTMLGKAYVETGAWGRVAEVRRRMASAALCLQRQPVGSPDLSLSLSSLFSARRHARQGLISPALGIVYLLYNCIKTNFLVSTVKMSAERPTNPSFITPIRNAPI
ncbi:unnamed protein product [Spirodela intermedia]|uniref:Pentatricopeptide repeat-containing protein n=1 Tax=Spirodela intermedia TaxID=51605 RepID=A0ABN7EDC8_SPIIN|nr:unnamed protein product [Spirodela intermedia]